VRFDLINSKTPVVTLLFVLACGFTGHVIAQSYSGQSQVPENLSFFEALTQGKTKALMRYSGQRRNSDLNVLQDDSGPKESDEKLQYYSAVGGYIGYETAPWFGVSAGATVYGATPFGANPDKRRGLGGLNEDDSDQDSYAALGEMYVKFQRPGHLLKVGRQEMPNYRMVSLSNIRFSPITHNGAVYENRVKKGLAINLGYIVEMKERNSDEFIDMISGARTKVSTNGKQLIRGDYDPADYDESGYIGDDKEMTMLGIAWQHNNFNIEAWNYYINDFINSVYLTGQYNFEPTFNDFNFSIAGQYTDQSDVGSQVAGDIDTWHYGVKISGRRRGLDFFASYNETEYNENSYDGGTLFLRWGSPQMFNSFQVQDSELGGTKSVGVGAQYDFGLNGSLPGVVMRLRYGSYDLPDKLRFTDARQDRNEVTFDLRYSFTKSHGFGIFTEMDGLSIQLRVAYDRYETNYDFEAYRDIHGYEFKTATSDFFDTRLYIDYQF